MTRQNLALLGTALLLTTLAVSPAFGVTWKTASSGTFSTGTNWNGDSAPLSTELAQFSFGSAPNYTVDFNANATTTGLTANTASTANVTHQVTFDLNGNTYGFSGAIQVMNTATANATTQLTIIDGILSNTSSSNSSVGPSFGANGNVFSKGVMRVSTGGTFSSQGSSGTFSVGRGNNSQGEVIVDNGGKFLLPNISFNMAASNATSAGTLSIANPNSLFTTRYLNTQRGTSTIDITDGGTLTVERDTALSNSSAATAETIMSVKDSGSIFTTNNLFVGGTSSTAGGNATLIVGAGAAVSTSTNLVVYQNDTESTRGELEFILGSSSFQPLLVGGDGIFHDNSALTVSLENSFDSAALAGQTLDLLVATGSLFGEDGVSALSLSNLAIDLSSVPNGQLLISGGTLQIAFDAAPVPEPGTWGLAMLGMLGMLRSSRRRRSARRCSRPS